MQNPSRYCRYEFEGFSGYLIPEGDSPHQYIAIYHSAAMPPWRDAEIHSHQASEEFYLLLKGQLWFLVGGNLVRLKPEELLMFRPGVPHAIVRGEGLIEHFYFRAPVSNDRISHGFLPVHLPPLMRGDDEREYESEWGFRLPLHQAEYQNRWSIGFGAAPFHSDHLLFVFLNFPAHESANAGLGTRHRLHLHRESWEYYVVLKGAKTLQIEDSEISISPGNMIEVSPGTRHALKGREAPFLGFTFRVPVRDDKVEF
jgi:mannose-6-phosphate isomerase-like protein (cupin superfamily)